MERLKWLWQYLRRIARALGILVLGGVLALGGLSLYNQHLHAAADEVTFHQLVAIINANLQQGKLVIPPEMQGKQPPAAPAAAPKPPDPKVP